MQHTLTYNQGVTLRSRQSPGAFPDTKAKITREFVHPYPLVLDLEYLTPPPDGSSGETHDFMRVPDELVFPFGDGPCLFKVVHKDAEARIITVEVDDSVEIVQA